MLQRALTFRSLIQPIPSPMNCVDSPINTILKMKLTQTRCNVFLYWGIPCSGKTTSMQKVTTELQRPSKIFNGVCGDSMYCNFYEQLNVISKPKHISNLFHVRANDKNEYPILVFDDFTYFYGKKDVHAFINELVWECQYSQNYSAVLVVDSAEQVVDILEHHPLIEFIGHPGIGKWHASEITQFINSSLLLNNMPKKQQLLDLAITAGCVGFFNDVLKRNMCPHYAAAFYSKQWSDGIKTLKPLLV